MFRSSNSSHARSMRIVGAAVQSAWVRAPQTATLDASSFWYASQQSCPPSPYQPARLALALGMLTPALLLETHTFRLIFFAWGFNSVYQ